jgi:hypothetical protein
MTIVYPVERLLAQPKIFYAIANYLEGPDAETLRNSFYDLLEVDFGEQDAEDCEFEAQEVCFESEDDGAIFTIQLDNGVMCKLEAVEGEVRAQIKTDRELAASSAIYQRLVSAIEDSCPQFIGDIALCSPPTPGNNYLSSSNGESFEGIFHLKSNPDEKFSFNVLVIDPDADEMKATVKPIL